ncbi:MAG TPA: alpha/beta hydrolase [Chloroflexota bacterium]|nr:alpha/beta hydrolase [Chloroflexota bacterium]
MKRYIRPYTEVQKILIERAHERRNPFDYMLPAESMAVLEGLDTLEYAAWAKAFSGPGPAHEMRAQEAQQRGDLATAHEEYMLAYGCWRVARYPCMNSPAKQAAYRKSQELFMKASQYMDPPVERVEMPFTGRPGEGHASIGLLRRPKSDWPLPVVVAWGGIDSFKEERRVDLFLERGFAGLNIDMPGVADAPLAGSEDAERLWDAVLDWIAAQPFLDAKRVVLWGGSTGGYWAAKLAHTHRERLAAVLEQGGAIHYAFQPEWIEESQHGEYPFELAETLACAFGGSGFDYWLDRAPKLSLLEQGILERPCAPMLCINGLHDSTFPVADQYLLLQHGSPKSIRLYDAGHMGHTSRTMNDMLTWVQETLGRR